MVAVGLLLEGSGGWRIVVGSEVQKVGDRNGEFRCVLTKVLSDVLKSKRLALDYKSHVDSPFTLLGEARFRRTAPVGVRIRGARPQNSRKHTKCHECNKEALW
jgi:hypothetical protein